MEVNKVTAGYTTAAQNAGTTVSKANKTDNKATEAAAAQETAAVYEKSTYSVYKPDAETINKIKAEARSGDKLLQDLVAKLLNKQTGASENYLNLLTKKNMTDLINSNKIDQAVVDKAKEDISEDGYFGVKKTTERIMAFAKALSGGDPSKIDTLRDAVEKGFKEAERMWGGKLPEISQQTYNAVMSEFDKWKESAVVTA